MSTITSPIILDETGKAIVEAIKALKTSTGNICYGMHIDGNESDPSAKVTYLRDAVGMTPVKMNFLQEYFLMVHGEMHSSFLALVCLKQMAL